MGRKNAGIKTVCENRKARHDYFIHETYEAGIALQGTEVKSLRAGRANLKDSYASIQDGELFVDDGAALHGAGQEDLYLLGLDALGDLLRPARRGPRLDGAKLFEPCGLAIHWRPFGVDCLLV